MKAALIGLAAAGALVTAVAYGQDRGPPGGPFHGGPGYGSARARMSPDDIAAFTDARIAALHAGLKLSADQEKLLPPVEDSLRGLARQRQEARSARRERFAAMREGGRPELPDMPGVLRQMADRQAASADSLRKLADASQPLFASLDEAQKRRLAILSRGLQPGMRGGPGGGRHGGWMRRGELGNGRDFASEAPQIR